MAGERLTERPYEGAILRCLAEMLRTMPEGDAPPYTTTQADAMRAMVAAARYELDGLLAAARAAPRGATLREALYAVERYLKPMTDGAASDVSIEGGLMRKVRAALAGAPADPAADAGKEGGERRAVRPATWTDAPRHR